MSKAGVGIWVLRLALAGVYLGAAWPKIMDPWSFARAIGNFHILPHAWIPVTALWLPIVEAAAALALLTGVLRRGGLLLLTLLSVVFFVAVGSAVARGLDIECGCFGSTARLRAGLGHLILNAGLIGAGVVLMTTRGRSPGRR